MDSCLSSLVSSFGTALADSDVVMGVSSDGSIQPDKMTKEQLKSWLNEHEFYEEIQLLNQNKKAKKQDWVDTVRRVM